MIANPVAGVDFDGGKQTAQWDMKNIDGDLILTPGTYNWRGLYNPGLQLKYKFTYYPYPTSVAWQTPDKSGGWPADHEAPRSVARHGNTMWLGAFAESGDSIIQVDTDMNKLSGEYRLWLAEPGLVCSDGQWVYYLAEVPGIRERFSDCRRSGVHRRHENGFGSRLRPDREPRRGGGRTNGEGVGDRAHELPQTRERVGPRDGQVREIRAASSARR